jgi:hypothetical protein
MMIMVTYEKGALNQQGSLLHSFVPELTHSELPMRAYLESHTNSEAVF